MNVANVLVIIIPSFLKLISMEKSRRLEVIDRCVIFFKDNYIFIKHVCVILIISGQAEATLAINKMVDWTRDNTCLFGEWIVV